MGSEPLEPQTLRDAARRIPRQPSDQSTRLRVGIIAWGPIDSRANGYLIRVSNIAEGLARLGHLVTVYELGDKSTKKAHEWWTVEMPIGARLAGRLSTALTNRLSFDPLALVESQASLFKGLKKLKKDMAKNDIVLVEGGLLFLTLLMVRRNGLHVLFDTHNLNALLGYRLRRIRPAVALIRMILWGGLEWLAMRLASATLFVSNEEKLWAERVLGLKKPGYVLPHLIDDGSNESQPGVLEQSLEIRGNSRQVVATFVGDMTSFQNRAAADFIVKKISPALCKTHPEVRLVLAGRLPRGEHFDAPENVMYLGFVPQIHSLMSQSDLLIAPMPYASGVSSKLQLYLESGRPILATKNVVTGLSLKDGAGVFVVPIENFTVKLIDFIENLLGTYETNKGFPRDPSRFGIMNNREWNGILSEIIEREATQ